MILLDLMLVRPSCHCLVMLVIVVLAFCATPTVAQSLETELRSARVNEQTAKEVYEKYRKLAARGTISGQQLRVAKYQWKLARLDLLDVRYPDQREEIEQTRIRIKFAYEDEIFQVQENLFRNRSISKLQYDRARLRFENAKKYFVAVQNKHPEKLVDVRVAQKKRAQARVEYEKAQDLFKLRAISQVVLERFQSQLRMAEQELETARRALGVRVQVLEKPSSESSSGKK